MENLKEKTKAKRQAYSKMLTKRSKKSASGITLIALVITIIVLLILAGVTIAALTGSDSAPAKANEAKQKQDIGAAKDEVYLAAQNAQTEAYERVYVDGKQVGTDAAVTASDASTNVGSYVISKLKEKYDANPEVGLAKVTVSDDGKIIISTTDFTEKAYIEEKGGTLNWGGEMAPTNIKVGNNIIDLNKLNATTVSNYYGEIVAKINNVDYGLFYVDYEGDFGEKGTVYLKALDPIERIHATAPETESSDGIKIMKELNPDWAKEENRGNAVFSNYSKPEKGAMYLCNPNVPLWSGIRSAFEIKYGKEKINYVIGGPSIELFCASYNAKVKPNSPLTTKWVKTGEVTFSNSGGRKNTNNGYVYIVNNEDYYDYFIKGDIRPTEKGMYVNSRIAYWMCSPSVAGYGVDKGKEDFLCAIWVGTPYEFFHWDNDGDHMKIDISPIVSLKPGVNLAVE